MRLPGLDHPITIEPAAERVLVRLGEQVIADTSSALVLREASYRPVYYVPLSDVDAAVLRRSESHTYCPFKGRASYYDVAAGDAVVPDAVWTYEQPYPAVAQIAGHVAFYPHLVDISTVDISAA